MERESNPMEALCRSGCGFYGNPSTDGLCSVCFKEALKKKQQPPATTPSPVSAPFVPAVPTPLAAAAPTVPALPAQPQAHTDSRCPTRKYQKIIIMENDPNKKESKGKRILKKAIRRNSKSNNNSQSSPMDQSIAVSRSKSFENKRLSIEINDSAPLPMPDGTKEKEHVEAGHKKLQDERPYTGQGGPSDELKLKKVVEIQETRNEVFGESAAASRTSAKSRTSPRLDKRTDRTSEIDPIKKNLKRKLEEESGAGTSGTSTGTSDTDADDKDPSKDKKKKNRCAVCRKKVGLTGFECRCGGLFCAVHRYSDKHECSFDYRELGAQEIRRNNPVVVSQKIHKI